MNKSCTFAYFPEFLPGDNKKGFTLIELLVVVLIIGILSAVALPQYEKAAGKARLSELLLWSRAVAQAENIYYLANGTYTDQITDLDIQLSGASVNPKGDGVIYPGGAYVYIISADTGENWHIEAGGNGLGVVIQRMLTLPYDRCVATVNRQNIGKYLCKNIGGYDERGPDANGSLIYSIPQ